MPYSEFLADRIRRQLNQRKDFEEKRMFGGIGFFLNGNMCVGIWKESLIARVGPQQYEEALQEPFVGKFNITGRAMTGWVLVGPEGIEDGDQLQEWIERAVKFIETLPAK